MTNEEKIAFKNTLKQFAVGVIEQRVAASKQAMNSAQDAANNEEKSSAGDKYETARAMGHLEKDMHAHQLAAHLKDLGLLQAIDVNTIYKTVAAGAYIQCAQAGFFIAAGLGKQPVDEKQIIFLSPQAPLIKLLIGKKAGDRFLFNEQQTEIVDLF